MHDAEVVPATNCQTNWIHEPVSPVAGGIFPKVVCATVAGDADSLLERIVAATYDKCRANPSCALIPNFPDFRPLLA